MGRGGRGTDLHLRRFGLGRYVAIVLLGDFGLCVADVFFGRVVVGVRHDGESGSNLRKLTGGITVRKCKKEKFYLLDNGVQWELNKLQSYDCDVTVSLAASRTKLVTY